MRKITLSALIITIILIFLSACSHNKDKTPTAESSYTEAMRVLKEKRYVEAAEKFSKVSDDFPLSKWAPKAQVMAAYASYKDKRYEEVIRITEDFIKSNPANDAVAYMQYLRALTYYDLIPTIERGQNDSQLASYAFRELVARFPDTIYAQDAKKKLVVVDEHLAGAKMSIGRYDIRVQNYVGAIKNFELVVSRYKSTNQVPEAYFRLFEVYYKLGMKDKAQESAEILQNQYPDNQWTGKLKASDYLN